MKNLTILALASAGLLLAACDRNPPPSTLTSVSGTVVEGNFEETATSVRLATAAWTGGAGTVRGYLIGEDGPGEQPDVTGSLAADGKFNLALPMPAAAQLTALDTDPFGELPEGYEFAEDCLPQVKVSDRSVRSTTLLLEVDAAKDGPVLPLALSFDETPGQGKVNLSLGGLMYVDRSVTLEGTRTCTAEGERLTVQVNLRLGKGWNKVQFAVTASESAGTATVSAVSGNFSSDNWVFLNGALSGQSTKAGLPKPSFLR